MFEIMTREATSCDLKELVQKFVPEAIGREIEKAARSIYPLQNVYIHKAKILKAPKFDVSKLLELHGESTDVRSIKYRFLGVRWLTFFLGDRYTSGKGLQGARSSRICLVDNTCYAFVLPFFLVSYSKGLSNL
jgi:hypothetical protein